MNMVLMPNLKFPGSLPGGNHFWSRKKTTGGIPGVNVFLWASHILTVAARKVVCGLSEDLIQTVSSKE